MRNVIIRIMNFDKQDFKHCWWLTKRIIKHFVMWDFDESDEAWRLLKLHLHYTPDDK